jgi:hypothetical protein
MIFLVRVLTPSVRPLLQGRVRPALTAARSSSRPLQKLCRWGRSVPRARTIHSVSLESLPLAGVSKGGEVADERGELGHLRAGPR